MTEADAELIEVGEMLVTIYGTLVLRANDKKYPPPHLIAHRQPLYVKVDPENWSK